MLEGIAKSKAGGVYRGRKPSIDQAQAEKLRHKMINTSQAVPRGVACRILSQCAGETGKE